MSITRDLSLFYMPLIGCSRSLSFGDMCSLHLMRNIQLGIFHSLHAIATNPWKAEFPLLVDTYEISLDYKAEDHRMLYRSG